MDKTFVENYLITKQTFGGSLPEIPLVHSWTLHHTDALANIFNTSVNLVNTDPNPCGAYPEAYSYSDFSISPTYLADAVSVSSDGIVSIRHVDDIPDTADGEEAQIVTISFTLQNDDARKWNGLGV